MKTADIIDKYGLSHILEQFQIKSEVELLELLDDSGFIDLSHFYETDEYGD